MDVQVQELIDKIKRDGIESASSQTQRMLDEAKAEAERIVQAARKEADAIVSKGKADAERFQKAAEASLEQSSRNLVLAFRSEIDKLLQTIIGAKVEASLDEAALKGVVADLVKNWADKGGESVDLLLSGENLKKLEGYFREKLASELKKGLELKSDRSLGAGFRIAARDGSAYYDFSAQAVAEQLSAYLNPRLAQLLNSAAKGV